MRRGSCLLTSPKAPLNLMLKEVHALPLRNTAFCYIHISQIQIRDIRTVTLQRAILDLMS